MVLAAFDEGKPAGYVKLGLDLSASLDVGHGSLWVFPGFLRRGVGRALASAALREVGARGRDRLLIEAPHTGEADAFACALGGRCVGTNLRSRLVLDEPARRRLAALSSVSAPDHCVVRWSGACPDHLLGSYARAWSQLDVPVNGQARVGMVTAADVRNRETEAVRAGHRCHVSAAVDGTGDIVGYSTVFVRDSPMADAGEILVLKERRRAGLGIRLKADLLTWVVAIEPQVMVVQAWNDEDNRAVVELNRKLGFVASTSWTIYEFSG